MNLARAYKPSRAFTLIEIVISSALMALILVSGYLCLHASVNSQKIVEPRVEILQNARVAMALMAADLRDACPLSKNYDFLGMHRTLEDIDADNLDFATHNYTPRRAGEGDFCQTSYYVAKDPETGIYSLWRRRNPAIAMDALSGGNQEEIARGILGVRFDYFDGLDWYDTWGEIKTPAKEQNSQKSQPNLSGLPEAVRITLLMDSEPRTKQPEFSTETTNRPPLVFQTIVYLNLTAAAQKSSGSSTSSDTSSDSTSGAIPSGIQSGESN